MLQALAIFAVGLAGGLAPLFLKWKDRGHHAALAFSTGIFLGAVEICCTMPPARWPGELCKLTGSTLLALIFFGVKFVASMSL